MNIIQPQKRKAILTLSRTWMNLKQTTLRQATQKDNYRVIPPDEAQSITLKETEGVGKGDSCNCWEAQSSGDGRWSVAAQQCESINAHRTVHLECDSNSNFYILDSLIHTEKSSCNFYQIQIYF